MISTMTTRRRPPALFDHHRDGSANSRQSFFSSPQTARGLHRRFIFLILAISILLTPSSAQHEHSLDAFVPAAHKTVFASFNLLTLGDANLASSSIAGRVAIGGTGELHDFSINGSPFAAAGCNKYAPALVAEGRVAAAMGSINNGYAITGRSSKIAHSVRMTCSSRVENYNPPLQNIRSFEEYREGLIRESGQVCFNRVSGVVGTEGASGEIMTLTPGDVNFSCYSVFKTSVSALAKIQRLEFRGNDTERNVLLNISGKSAALRDFAMVGFNPLRTLITFCGIQGHVELFNARMHGSIFAPTTQFTVMGSVLNGSLIAGHIRGKVAILDQPYSTC